GRGPRQRGGHPGLLAVGLQGQA
ncbi:MAG: hypothetical protein AVDCRST_MAG70-1178, partial [uncultured Thermomicrobiales bacterium]